MKSTRAELIPDTVLMIRPAAFGYNDTTAPSNPFQRTLPDMRPAEVHARALSEFDSLAGLLRDEGVTVLSFDDSEEPWKPDAVFPNNWVSTNPDGTLVLYPMESGNRRGERRPEIIESLRRECGYAIVDLTAFEKEGRYLEGTGSMVFDRSSSTVYACLSSRTDRSLLDHFASACGFHRVLPFRAVIPERAPGTGPVPIYHTNVMMSVGMSAAVVCSETIMDAAERDMVLGSLRAGGKKVVDIALAQLFDFAGNLLQLRSNRGGLLWVMSTRACESLTRDQQSQLEADGSRLVHTSLDTIETVGGGSARCMLAEIFRPSERKRT